MRRGSTKGGGVWEQCGRVARHGIGRRSKIKEEAGLPLQGERKQIARADQHVGCVFQGKGNLRQMRKHN